MNEAKGVKAIKDSNRKGWTERLTWVLKVATAIAQLAELIKKVL